MESWWLINTLWLSQTTVLFLNGDYKVLLSNFQLVCTFELYFLFRVLADDHENDDFDTTTASMAKLSFDSKCYGVKNYVSRFVLLNLTSFIYTYKFVSILIFL